MENNTVTTLNKSMIIKNSIRHAISYKEYRELVEKHVENGTSTGPVQSEDLSQFTLLNHSRMRRLDKTLIISDLIIDKLQNYNGKQTWLVITESWCGDAAQVLPVINKVSELSSGINLKIVLRDEHLDLMDIFLSNGSRAIPKLIACDPVNYKVIDTWGPRPLEATRMVREYKTKHGMLTPEFKRDLQIWYNKDKGERIIRELVELIQ